MTIGNDLHLKHSVGLVMRELHAFAAATGAPAGEDVFRWAEAKWAEVSEALAAARRVARPAPQQPTYGRLTVPAGLNRPHNGDCLPACYHEPYQGSCVHCGVPFRNGRPTPATPAGGEELREKVARARPYWNGSGNKCWSFTDEEYQAILAALQPQAEGGEE